MNHRERGRLKENWEKPDFKTTGLSRLDKRRKIHYIVPLDINTYCILCFRMEKAHDECTD
ncbi:hypothetical protein NEISICOT_00944 [Neisseria sicca ATCC 29256]|uniref:Uncharacterized protein n=1 Tax=Neisseria sicca ATCC 29256 TaxID=547045 RepID=C6M353_NEISI|nr:hypothetical protein NEISICOT_00944 [Neisseria sicca ATCC 29256]